MSLDQLIQDFNEDAAEALKASFSLVAEPQTLEPGEPVTLRLLSSLTSLAIPQLAQAPIDLNWLGKLLSFGSPAISSAEEAGSRLSTVAEKLAAGAHEIASALPNFGDTDPPAAPNGVAGVAGLLQAALPLRLPLVPVRLRSLRWTVTDEEGVVREEHRDYIVQRRCDLPVGDTTMQFAPPFEELLEGQPPIDIQTWEVSAELELSVWGRPDPVEVPLLTVPVKVPVLRVPTVLALYVQPNFDAKRGLQDGPVAIVVPSRSPFRHTRVEELRNELLTLQASVAPLRAFAHLAPMVAGLADLCRALNPQRRVGLVGADEIQDLSLVFFEGGSVKLEQVTAVVERLTELATDTLRPVTQLTSALGLPALRPTGPPGFLRLAAGDSINSLIFFAAPGRFVQLFNRRDFESGHGAITVTIPKGVPRAVLVRDLDTGAPASEPPSALAVTAPPRGRRCLIYRIDSFGDQLSSLKFGPEDT